MLTLGLYALGFMAKLFGAVSVAEQLFAAAQQRREGRIEQHAADLEASHKVQTQVAQAAANAPQDDQQVDAILRQGKL